MERQWGSGDEKIMNGPVRINILSPIIPLCRRWVSTLGVYRARGLYLRQDRALLTHPCFLRLPSDISPHIFFFCSLTRYIQFFTLHCMSLDHDCPSPLLYPLVLSAADVIPILLVDSYRIYFSSHSSAFFDRLVIYGLVHSVRVQSLYLFDSPWSSYCTRAYR